MFMFPSLHKPHIYVLYRNNSYSVKKTYLKNLIVYEFMIKGGVQCHIFR